MEILRDIAFSFLIPLNKLITINTNSTSIQTQHPLKVRSIFTNFQENPLFQILNPPVPWLNGVFWFHHSINLPFLSPPTSSPLVKKGKLDRMKYLQKHPPRESSIIPSNPWSTIFAGTSMYSMSISFPTSTPPLEYQDFT